MIRCLLFFMLLGGGLIAQPKQTAAQYVERYKDIAITEMERYGIPASIKLGQGILESSAGNSDLAMEANNHFGIKCKKDWTGPSFYKDDDAKDECFRKYTSVLESYEDHSQFLKNSQRYASLFLLEPDDYKGWAHGLKKAGYATNPQYAQLLIKTIEENRLFQYDTKVIAKGEPAKPEIKARPKQGEEEVAAEIRIGKQGGREVLLRNNVKYVLAHDGDTPETLARELDLLAFQIPKYNEFSSSSVRLKPGQLVYIQPKRKKGQEKSVKVKPGESLHDIAQEHAVKLKSLQKINQLGGSQEIREGQVIKLR